MRTGLRAAVIATVATLVCALAGATAQAYTLPCRRAVRLPDRRALHPALDGQKSSAATARSPPAAGLYNVCYVNTFQTQPDELAWWEANHPDLLLRKSDGRYVIDGEWNEVLLDTRTAAKRTALNAIFDGWFRRCKADGFDAIEPDNLDSWSRSRSADHARQQRRADETVHPDRPRRRPRDRAEDTRARSPASATRLRLRDRGGVPGLHRRVRPRVRRLPALLREPRLRDRVHRQPEKRRRRPLLVQRRLHRPRQRASR